MVESKELQEVRTAPVARKETGHAEVEATRGETFETPDVDIYETTSELVLLTDVPGVAKDGVELKLENGVLEITCHRASEKGQEPVYAEFKPSSYYRAFRLSDEIDADKIDASLQDGVLTVTLPKAPRARPRRIEVKSR
jgi:HSP20 family protein